MRISLGKVAPTAIVLAVVGYSAWPYLEARPSDDAPRPQITEIASALMQAVAKPGAGRDPFRLPGLVAGHGKAAAPRANARGGKAGAEAGAGAGARTTVPALLAKLSGLISATETY